MQIRNYPRPKNDTGIGFVYCDDASRYTREDLARVLPELRMMGASWLSLTSPAGRDLPEFFLREIIDGDIEPVVGIDWVPIASRDTASVARLLQKYSSYGVHYVYFFTNANLAASWEVDYWSQPNLVERFMDILIPCLDRAVEAGLYPLFTPLHPGGDYWDISFLSTAVDALKSRGKGYLFDRFGIAMRNIAHNKPLGWGKGGRKKWKDTRPYNVPAGSEDQRGFSLFEWYDEVLRSKLGYSLPMISVQSGATFQTWAGSDLPALDEDRHAQTNLEMAQAIMNGAVPDCVLNNSFWLLMSGTSSTADPDAWFRNDGTVLKSVGFLKDLTKHTRTFSWDKAPLPQTPFVHKSIYHYLLFATTEKGIARSDWQSALDYIERFQPTCGFSLDEAMSAEFVTIVGDALGVSPQIERAIRAAGCKVERLNAKNRRELKGLMKGMASGGKRFVSL